MAEEKKSMRKMLLANLEINCTYHTKHCMSRRILPVTNTGRANLGYLYLSRVVFTSVLCHHQSSGICFNYLLSDKNDRPLILSDKNRGNVDSICHQPVIYDVVTVNNCYL